MNVTCSAPVCPVILNSSCVFYEGESLVYTGINTNDSLQVALQKIDAALGLTTVVNIYNSDGVLTGNRNVLMNNFTLSFEKDVFIYNARVGRGAGAVVTNTVLGNSALNANTTGQYNTAVGISTLNLNTTGNYNTALGAYSLSNATTAEGNTGVGTSAMTFLTTGYSNTAVGFGALYKVVDGYQNVGVGRSALYELTSGNQNIGIGLSAGSSITTGSKNTIIGWGSGQVLSTGSSNTIIGANVSGLTSTTSNNIILSDGDGNIQFKDDGANTILPRLAGVGTRMVVAGATGALSSQAIPTGNITGSGNLGEVAFFTGASSIGGNSNLYWDSFNGRLGVGTNTPNRTFTVVGSFAVTGANIAITNTIVDGDIVIGSTNFLQMGSTRFRGNGTDFEFKDSGTNTTRALIATGTNVSYFNSGGNYHFGGTSDDGTNRLQVTGSAKITSDSTINGVSIGKGGGSLSTNTRVGETALPVNTTGIDNTAIGNAALSLNTTGGSNTAIGFGALRDNVSNSDNTAVGRAALRATIANQNTAVGSYAGILNTTGQRNTMVGYFAMNGNTTGSFNTAVGRSSLRANTTGSNNTSFGDSTMFNNTVGNNNTAYGNAALYISTGNNNVAVGNSAGRYILDGVTLIGTAEDSIFIGFNSRSNVDAQTNQIVIGTNAVGNGTNTATLGNSSTVGTYLRGKTILDASVAARASLNITTGVAPTTPTDGDVWSTTTDLLARINGTTYSLINSGLSGSGAAGQVTFWNSPSNITGSNSLFWDNTNGRLGIGHNVPLVGLDTRNGVNLYTSGTTPNSHYLELISNSSTDGYVNFRRSGGANGPAAYYLSGGLARLIYHAGTGETTLGAYSNAPLLFVTNSLERARFDNFGALNIGINTITSREANWSTVQIGQSIFSSRTSDGYTLIGRNVYTASTGNNLYVTSNTAAVFDIVGRDFSYYSAPSGIAGNAITFTKHLQLFGATGNLLIQNGGTFTDGGQRFQVTGTGFFSNAVQIGNGNNVTNGTNALTVVAYGSYAFNFNNSTGFTFPNIELNSGYLRINTGGTVFMGNNSFQPGADLFIHAGWYSVSASYGKVRIGTSFNSSVSRELAVFDMQNMNVGIGTATPSVSAKLQIDSTTQGFLPPRMTLAQRTAIATPAEGLIVFQTDGTIGLYVYANATWRSLTMV